MRREMGDRGRMPMGTSTRQEHAMQFVRGTQLAELPLATAGSKAKEGKGRIQQESSFPPRSPVAAMATQKGKKKGSRSGVGEEGKSKSAGDRKTRREERLQYDSCHP